MPWLWQGSTCIFHLPRTSSFSHLLGCDVPRMTTELCCLIVSTLSSHRSEDHDKLTPPLCWHTLASHATTFPSCWTLLAMLDTSLLWVLGLSPSTGWPEEAGDLESGSKKGQNTILIALYHKHNPSRHLSRLDCRFETLQHKNWPTIRSSFRHWIGKQTWNSHYYAPCWSGHNILNPRQSHTGPRILLDTGLLRPCWRTPQRLKYKSERNFRLMSVSLSLLVQVSE